MDLGAHSQVGESNSIDRSRVQRTQTLDRQQTRSDSAALRRTARKGRRLRTADDRHVEMVPDIGLVQGRTRMVPTASPRPDRRRRKSVHYPRARDGYEFAGRTFCATGAATSYPDSPSTAPRIGNPLWALNWRSATRNISMRWPICVFGCSRACARCASARSTQKPKLRPPPCPMRLRSRRGKGASISTRVLRMIPSASILPGSFIRTTL